MIHERIAKRIYRESGAYSLGYASCADDMSLESNPFERGTDDYHEWRDGWKHYDADYNPDYYSTANAIRNGWV